MDAQQPADDQVERALDHQVPPLDRDVARREQRNAVQLLELHLVLGKLEEVGHDIGTHVHLVALAQQPLDGAVRLPRQADDHPIDLLLHDHIGGILHRPQRLEAAHVGGALHRMVVEKADQLQPVIGARHHRAHHHAAHVARAHQQHALHADVILAQVAAAPLDRQTADAQQHGHQHGSVEKDEAAVEHRAEGQADDDDDHDAGSRSRGHAPDLFDPTAARAIGIDLRETEGD
jgi:hypothetical protein